MKMKTTTIAILTLSLASPLVFADDNNNVKSRVFGKIKALKNQIETNTNDIQTLSTQIQNLPGGGTPGNDAQVQANTTAITTLDAQVQANTSAIANGGGSGGGTPGNDAQVQSNTAAISTLNTQVQTNTGSISTLSGQVQGTTAQIQGNTSNINAIAAETQTNTAVNSTQASQIQANTATNATQDSVIQANTAANATQDTAIQTNTTTNTAQDTAIQTNTAANTAQDTQIQTNTAKVSELGSQVSTLQSDVNVQGTQTQTNSDNISGNTARITALENGAPPPPGPTPEPTAIDFLQYVPNVGTKEYLETTSVNVACKIIRHDISRVDNPADSDIHITETYTNGSANCLVIDVDYKLTSTSLSIVGYVDDFSTTNKITFETPGEILNNAMEVGKSLGFASANEANLSQIAIQKNTIMGIESVSVPAGNFTNCLKMHTTIKSNFFFPIMEAVSWHCPGLGEVKRVYFDDNAKSYITRRLTSVI